MRPHLTIQLPDSWGTVFGEGLRVSFQEEALLSRPSMPPECSGSLPASLRRPCFSCSGSCSTKGKGGESQHRRW